MTRPGLRLLLTTLLLAIAPVSLRGQEPEPTPSPDPALVARVTAMARIGSAFSPSWSPDGTRLAYVSNLGGSFQVWVVPAAGGYPQLVTTLDDAVSNVQWSPKADLLAFEAAPGGSFNAQIYTVRPDGTAQRRLTEVNQATNFFGGFTPDGKGVYYVSNARTAAASDGWVFDLEAGSARMVTKPGAGRTTIADLSKDGRYVLQSRQVARGSNDLVLLNRDSGNEELLTPHDGPGTFFGRISMDERAVYVGTNGGRDRLAFGKIAVDYTGRVLDDDRRRRARRRRACRLRAGPSRRVGAPQLERRRPQRTRRLRPRDRRAHPHPLAARRDRERHGVLARRPLRGARSAGRAPAVGHLHPRAAHARLSPR